MTIQIINEPCDFRMEQVHHYQGDISILQQMAHLVDSNSASPDAVVATAMDLQGIHNAEDAEWIKGLGVEPRLIPQMR